MGNPKSTVNKITSSVGNAVSDIGKGVGQVMQGNIQQGVTTAGTGFYNTSGGGVAGTLAGFGVTGQTDLEKAAQAAEAQAAGDKQTQLDAASAAKALKTQNRLNAEVALRQKTPGKAQTLLTVGATPSATKTNTLLTSAASAIGTR